MEDRDWMILEVLYHKKSMTKAAESLFISQPAITNRLRQMEEDFGVKIVHRGSKGVQFTPQGEFLAKSAEEVLLKFRQIKDRVLSMESEIAGTLRVGASYYVTKYRLPSLLKRFQNHYPKVEFKVTTTWSRDMFSLLSKQDVQVGFIRSDDSWIGEKHLLLEEPICIAFREKIPINNLPALPRIDYQTDPGNKQVIDNWWRENFIQPPLVSMNVDRVDTAKEMVLYGLGYAFLPDTIFSAGDEVHKTYITNSYGERIVRNTWMIYQQEALESKVVQAFVDFVKINSF